jgi:site-specific recombinase XerD
MITNDSFTILFFTRKERINNQGEIPIYCRITVNGQRAEISLKKYILPKLWDSKTNSAIGKNIESKKINDYLRVVRNKIHDHQSYLFEKNQVITARKIKNLFLGKEDDRKSLMEAFEYHNNQIKELIGKGYSKETYKRYNTTKNHIENYMMYQYKVKDVILKEIDFAFVQQFDVYLRGVKNCDNNTTVKYVKNFRKILNQALANEWIDKDPAARYKGKIVQKKRGFLNKEDVEKIENKTFSIERLEQIKDAFLLGCYTGLCYADLAKLTKDEIHTYKNGTRFILTDRTKTNVESYIPVDEKAEVIIEKYKDHPKIAINNKVIPMPSNQKTNAYLKEIQDLCGIEMNLTFHLARHTFGTQKITDGYSLEAVKKMLGHKNITETQHYSKVTEERIWNEFNNLDK